MTKKTKKKSYDATDHEYEVHSTVYTQTQRYEEWSKISHTMEMLWFRRRFVEKRKKSQLCANSQLIHSIV